MSENCTHNCETCGESCPSREGGFSKEQLKEGCSVKKVIGIVSGKGGVGKTSVAATMVRLLCQMHPGKRILAIDADPAVGLATALGVEVCLTVDDIRKAVVAQARQGDAKAAVELLGEARCQIFDAVAESRGFAFLAIGRPESAGCYCKVNGYLKEVIGLLAGSFDYVVIDGEAGVEQINRRVMEKVTHLLLITDASRKGTQVIQTVKKVADELVMYDQVGAIVNRLPSREIIPLLDTGDIPVLSYIENDAALADFDIRGENVFYLPEEANIVRGVREAVEKLGI